MHKNKNNNHDDNPAALTQEDLLNRFKQLNFLRVATQEIDNAELQNDLSQSMYHTRQEFVKRADAGDLMEMDHTFRICALEVSRVRRKAPDAFRYMEKLARAYPKPVPCRAFRR